MENLIGILPGQDIYAINFFIYSVPQSVFMEWSSFIFADGYPLVFYHKTAFSTEKYFESHPPFHNSFR